VLTTAAEEAVETALALAESCGSEQRTTSDGTAWLVYFADAASAADFGASLERLATAQHLPLDLSSPQIVYRENWHDGWREYFRPVQVSSRLRVVPPWHRHTHPDNPLIELVIEPGMAFGTGTHETTQLCLRLLEGVMPAGARVLDAGTGSGILGIAALKLGASRVVGFDLDRDIAGNFRENLALNGIESPTFDLVIGPLEAVATRPPFDLLICNMLSREFLPLLPHLSAYGVSGTQLILSGFLVSESETIVRAVRHAGFRVMIREAAGDWCALAGRLD
jgi:ribosomal protein L11 methyltransferase